MTTPTPPAKDPGRPRSEPGADRGDGREHRARAAHRDADDGAGGLHGLGGGGPSKVGVGGAMRARDVSRPR